MKINIKVVAALSAVALAVYLLVPNLFYAALPLLILAACPLSMLLMMRMMSGNKAHESETALTPTASSPTREEHGR